MVIRAPVPSGWPSCSAARPTRPSIAWRKLAAAEQPEVLVIRAGEPVEARGGRSAVPDDGKPAVPLKLNS
jgi:hypothetical protein